MFTCDNQVTTEEDQVNTAYDEEAEATPANEILEGSKLPLRVIKRVHTGQKKDETNQDSWLRNNIFRTQVEC